MTLYGICKKQGYCSCGLCQSITADPVGRVAKKPWKKPTPRPKPKPAPVKKAKPVKPVIIKPKEKKPPKQEKLKFERIDLPNEVYLECGCAELGGKKVLYCLKHRPLLNCDHPEHEQVDEGRGIVRCQKCGTRKRNQWATR